MARPQTPLNFTIRVQGVDALVQKADRIGGQVRIAVRRVIREYALKIERTAKKLAPVDTGRLRSSIRTVLEDLAAAVLTDVGYAPFQEFGTGRRGAAAGIETPTGYNYGSRAGISPNSFMRPALDRHQAAFVRDLIAAVRRHT